MADQVRTKIKKKAMIEALKKSLGVVTPAAANVGIDPDTHYEWLRKDPKYRDEVEKLQDRALDFAESKLFNIMQTNGKGATTATIFYLKTKGKKRGYIESTEMSVKGLRDEGILSIEQQRELAEEILKTPDKDNLLKKYDDFKK